MSQRDSKTNSGQVTGAQVTDERGMRKRLLPDIVQLLYRQGAGAMFIAILIALLVVIVLWTIQPPEVLSAWAGAVTLMQLLRYAVTIQYRKRSRRQKARFWKGLFLVGLALNGVIWGSATLLFFPEGSDFHQVFMIFIFSGMAAGAVGAYSISTFAILSYIIPLLTPILVRFFMMGTLEHTVMGLMVALFIAGILLTSLQVKRSILLSFKLRYEKADLVDYLTQAMNQAEEANRELEKSLEHINRVSKMAEAASVAKGEFLANMSHEIRTPLTGVIGMTELAMEGPLTDEQRQFLRTVLESANALLGLMNDILDFSRLESGKLSIHPEILNLPGLIDDVLKSFEYKAQKQGVRLVSALSSSLPKLIISDPLRLRQVLINLVDNAIKFTPTGEITVAISSDSRNGEPTILTFSVTDTGIGIPGDHLDIIFETFTQVDGSSTRPYGGTGLGLAICRELVKMMGGVIWVDSQPGKGSKFQFTIMAELPSDEFNDIAAG